MRDVPTLNSYLPFIVSGVFYGAVYGLAAVGLVVTYRTSGLFNFAHGAVAALGAFIFFQLWQLNRLPWPIAIGIAVLVLGPLLGLLLERLASGLEGSPVTYRVVATLGLLVIVQQSLMIHYGTAAREFPQFLPVQTFRMGGVYIGWNQVIVLVISIASTAGLSLLLRTTQVGRAMRGVVDNAPLIAATGTNPTVVRRLAWCIGSSFAALCGVLLAPSIGLDANILTLLVIQAFGAAAIGLFRSLPLTFLGGIVIGVAANLSSRFTADVSWLRGLPPSLPFIVLFLALVIVPAKRLAVAGIERRARTIRDWKLGSWSGSAAALAVAAVVLILPQVDNIRVSIYARALVFVLVFLSLTFLERMSGLLCLCQLTFVGIGAAIYGHLTHDAGVPWLLAVITSGLVALPLGVFLALPTSRLTGLYLALATFGFGLLTESLLYPRGFLYGGTQDGLVAPRPNFARGDNTYYYLLAVIVLLAIFASMMLRRSRLGRLLRAMADSPGALSTHGTSPTSLKIIVFAISAMLAGVAGALVGPVTGQVNPTSFSTFSSLQLVVILALQSWLPEIPACIGAAFVTVVLPSYIGSSSINEYLPVLFGGAAIVTSLVEARLSRTSTLSALGTVERVERLEGRSTRSTTTARLRMLDGDREPVLDPA